MLPTALAVLGLSIASALAVAQTTPFTYQGQLTFNGAPFSGATSVFWDLYDAPAGGNRITPSSGFSPVQVLNGLFTADVSFDSRIDFGRPLWLQITAIDPNTGQPTVLSPRQPLRPAPSALGLSGSTYDPTGKALYAPNPPTVVIDNGAGWQSFLAPASGRVSSLQLFQQPVGFASATFTLYDGRGTGGPVLAGPTLIFLGSNAAWIGPDLPQNLSLQPGREYTLGVQHSAGGLFYTSTATLTPGTARSPSSNAVYAMRLGSDLPGLGVAARSADSVLWANVVGVPASLASPFFPWTPATGGMTTSVGNVGINAATPVVPFHFRAPEGSSGDQVSLGTRVLFDMGPGPGLLAIQSTPGWRTGVVFGAPGQAVEDAGIYYHDAPFQRGLTFRTGGTQRMAIDINGVCRNTSGTWSTLSDERAKQNITPLTGSLEKLLRLDTIEFEYRPGQGDLAQPGRHAGFRAQDVQRLFPDWVSTDDRGILWVGERGFSAIATTAIRELHDQTQTRLDALRAENTALRGELASVHQRLAELERLIRAK